MADGGTDHLTPGTILPPVSLPATDGREVSIASLPGRSVIAVYPWTGRPGLPNPPNWDDIPGAHGSTPELEGFRDRAQAFVARDLGLFALSRQGLAYQRELVGRLRLPFPVLSDAEGHFASPLALPTFSTGGEIYLKRLTLLVADGRIAHVFYPVPDPSDHASDVLNFLEGKG